MSIIDILKMVLPVLVAITIGFLCKKKQLFDAAGLATLKTVISKLMLPVVLFNAFFTANYNINVLIVFIFMYIACCIAIVTGYLTRKIVKPFHKFMPFLLSGFEAGMLGYALYGVLVGAEHASTFAMIDIGQTIFVYTIFLAALQATDGEKPTAKGIIINVLKNPIADGMMLGVILGIIGVGKLVLASPISGIYKQMASFITAPTAFIILIVVGYELSLKKELLRPVFITVGLRVAICAILLVIVSTLTFIVIPFEKNLMIAFMVMFSLPAPFVIPLFTDVKNDAEYISTSLSVSTLCTIGLFMVIAVYSTM